MARRHPALAALLAAGISPGARVAAPLALRSALRDAGFIPADDALEAAILDRAALVAGELARARRSVRPGGALILQRPRVLDRLRGREPALPGCAPLLDQGGWAAWRVLPLEALRPRDGIVTRALGADLFLVDLRSGATFRLNAAGKAVWDALVAGRSLDEAAAALPNAPPDRARADVEALARDLAEAGLLAAP